MKHPRPKFTPPRYEGPPPERREWATLREYQQETVKQARLDGGVDDTFQTEAEHAGYRAKQGRLELPTVGCNCWVRNATGPERFTIRVGAHCPSCPTFASSRDPVDQARDLELHELRCQDAGALAAREEEG